jgi:hypothetical protein
VQCKGCRVRRVQQQASPHGASASSRYLATSHLAVLRSTSYSFSHQSARLPSHSAPSFARPIPPIPTQQEAAQKSPIPSPRLAPPASFYSASTSTTWVAWSVVRPLSTSPTSDLSPFVSPSSSPLLSAPPPTTTPSPRINSSTHSLVTALLSVSIVSQVNCKHSLVHRKLLP